MALMLYPTMYGTETDDAPIAASPVKAPESAVTLTDLVTGGESVPGRSDCQCASDGEGMSAKICLPKWAIYGGSALLVAMMLRK